MEHRFHPGDRVRIAEDAYVCSPRWNGQECVVLEYRGRMSDRHGESPLVLVDAGFEQNAVVAERHLTLVETLCDRIQRLTPFIESSRFALTEDDVRADYESGKHRYANRR